MKKVLSLILVLSILSGALSVISFADTEILSVYSSDRILSGSVRMTAHRGFSKIAPENTMPAFRLAGEYGFWGAECDISPTSDGVWVIMHDETVDRTTDGEGKVGELTFEEINNLTIDFGNNVEKYPGTKVPKLTEYLDICKEYKMHPVIEIKTCANVDSLDSLASLLLSREEKDMFIIISFGKDICARIKQLMPKTPVYLLIGGSAEDNFEEGIRFCLQNKLDGIDFAYVWDRDMVLRTQFSGLKTMVWTIDDIETIEKHYRWGVRDFTTNALTPGEPDGGFPKPSIKNAEDLFYYIIITLQSIFLK